MSRKLTRSEKQARGAARRQRREERKWKRELKRQRAQERKYRRVEMRERKRQRREERKWKRAERKRRKAEVRERKRQRREERKRKRADRMWRKRQRREERKRKREERKARKAAIRERKRQRREERKRKRADRMWRKRQRRDARKWKRAERKRRREQRRREKLAARTVREAGPGRYVHLREGKWWRDGRPWWKESRRLTLGLEKETVEEPRRDYLGRDVIGQEVTYRMKRMRREQRVEYRDARNWDSDRGRAYRDLHDALERHVPLFADALFPLYKKQVRYVEVPEIEQHIQDIGERLAIQRALDVQTHKKRIYMAAHHRLADLSPTLARALLPREDAPRVSVAQAREDELQKMRAAEEEKRRKARYIAQIRARLRDEPIITADNDLVLQFPIDDEIRADFVRQMDELRGLDPDRELVRRQPRPRREPAPAPVYEPNQFALFAGQGEALPPPDWRGMKEKISYIRDWQTPEETKGRVVNVLGTDPSKSYPMQYQVVELAALTTDADSDYLDVLQPRDRSRKASDAQIARIVSNFVPEELINTSYWLERGSPIISPEDMMVEGGNGRVRALRHVFVDRPEAFEEYKQLLQERADELGIDADSFDGMTAPVLVRARMTEVDREKFVEEINTRASLGMSALESAQTDAKKFTPEMIGQLEVGESQDIATALRSSRNAEFVRSFMHQLPETERSDMMGAQGELSQEGVRRISAAMFARVFDNDKLVSRMYESTDNDIRRVTAGMFAGLAKLTRAEELVKSGARSPELSVQEDLAVAAEKYSDLKSKRMSVEHYLAQGQLGSRELTPLQERILAQLEVRGGARGSIKKVRQFIEDWTQLVEQSPPPGQSDMFGGAPPSKDELTARWLERAEREA